MRPAVASVLLSIRLVLILILLLPLSAQAGPPFSLPDFINVHCPERLVQTLEDTSRTGFVLDFSDQGACCTVDGIVGGEHITRVGIIGTLGASYLIHFEEVDGSPGYYIEWPDEIPVRQGPLPEQHIVGPLNPSGFMLSLSAHPHGTYRLTISQWEASE